VFAEYKPFIQFHNVIAAAGILLIHKMQELNFHVASWMKILFVPQNFQCNELFRFVIEGFAYSTEGSPA